MFRAFWMTLPLLFTTIWGDQPAVAPKLVMVFHQMDQGRSTPYIGYVGG